MSYCYDLTDSCLQEWEACLRVMRPAALIIELLKLLTFSCVTMVFFSKQLHLPLSLRLVNTL